MLGTQQHPTGFFWIGNIVVDHQMPINPEEIIALVHRGLLDPVIVSVTVCLVFVAGFIFGYGVRAHISRQRHRRYWSRL